MKEPKLTLAFAQRGDRPILQISRNDSAMFNRLDWDLGRLDEYGHLGARAQIGEIALMMLHIAHPKVFEPYPSLSPPSGPLGSPSEAVQYLLNASTCDRTSRYVGAIDALIDIHKDELAGSSLTEQWPYYRDRFLRNYPD